MTLRETQRSQSQTFSALLGSAWNYSGSSAICRYRISDGYRTMDGTRCFAPREGYRSQALAPYLPLRLGAIVLFATNGAGESRHW